MRCGKRAAGIDCRAWSDLLPYLAFLPLSMLAIRNTPLFAIVAMPVVAGNLRGVWLTALERGWIRQSRQRFVTISIAVSMLALVAGVSAGVASDKVYRWLRWQRRFGVAETEHYPSGVVERLRAIEGRFFCTVLSPAYRRAKPTATAKSHPSLPAGSVLPSACTF